MGLASRLAAMGAAVTAVGAGDVAPGPLRERGTPALDLLGEWLTADDLPEPHGPDVTVFGPRQPARFSD